MRNPELQRIPIRIWNPELEGIPRQFRIPELRGIPIRIRNHELRGTPYGSGTLHYEEPQTDPDLLTAIDAHLRVDESDDVLPAVQVLVAANLKEDVR